MARPQADLGKIGEEAFKILEKQLLEEKKEARPNRDPVVMGIMDKDAARLWKGAHVVNFTPKLRSPQKIEHYVM
ncbi:hypothetical protein LOK49_LG12G01078 [Camellia lanceoleosa]|uniref:Uncharacterized protein n=1 Tax=Camellia lanceoleosa TaxID=1840588 RepID=A0ACC0FQ27_9ERIC|nr:hypothetical protein LOK49_LG12G01078 [Camellia lanceoleosa]